MQATAARKSQKSKKSRRQVRHAFGYSRTAQANVSPFYSRKAEKQMEDKMMYRRLDYYPPGPQHSTRRRYRNANSRDSVDSTSLPELQSESPSPTGWQSGAEITTIESLSLSGNSNTRVHRIPSGASVSVPVPGAAAARRTSN